MGLRRFRDLRILELDSNLLWSVPAELGQLASLVELHLDRNQLEELPPLGGLVQLEVLDVSGNPLRALPASLGQLTQLGRH